MMKASSILAAASVAAILFFASSCSSLQGDLLVSSAGADADSEIAALEKTIVPFDVSSDPEGLASARARIASLERKGIKDAVFEARLAAWSGRVFLLEGKTSEAEKMLKRSRSLLPGDAQSGVLASRLERDSAKRLALIDETLRVEPSSGELGLERARVLVELGRYREAVAAFDSAFPLLPGFYEVTWQDERNRAWSLRDLDGGASEATAFLASKNSLTWADALELAKANGSIPREFTPGKERSVVPLFKRLAARSFIPPYRDLALASASAGAAGTVRPAAIGDTVSRSDAAWFCWHLVAWNRNDDSLLSRYSARYRGMAEVSSPVSDVQATSPFFDSVLGCVESEIMALTDGMNFQPYGTVPGASFLQMLEKSK